VALGERIRGDFPGRCAVADSRGPAIGLTRDALTPQEAFDLVPANLWFDTLALLVRMVPGIGPDSIAGDYGDAAAGRVAQDI